MRISVVGTCGAGKSTLSKRLAAALDLPFIELDAINWQPGWRALSEEAPQEFLTRVKQATQGDRWVCDGNYGVIRSAVWPRATHLVWLDYGLSVIMPRVIRRSIARAATRRELWPGTGNRETVRRWIKVDHPLRWTWDTCTRRREEYERLIEGAEAAHLCVHRLRRPCEADALVEMLRYKTGRSQLDRTRPDRSGEGIGMTRLARAPAS